LGKSLIFVSLGILPLAAITAALMAGAARADEGVPFKAAFTVQAELLTAITGCDSQDTNCQACLKNSGFYVEAQGIGDTSQGPLFFEVLNASIQTMAPLETTQERSR
jgi:hypothetical protein